MPHPLPPLTHALITGFTLLFTSANIYAARAFSLSLVLRGYLFVFGFAMYSLAFVIMVLGILVPPVMLAHWGYEVWTEVGPIDEGERVEGEAEGVDGEGVGEREGEER